MLRRRSTVVSKPSNLYLDILKAVIPLLVGFLSAIGLLFSPLQKIIFDWLWSEQPSISLSVDTNKPVEGDTIGVNVLVSPETVVGLSGGSLMVAVEGPTGTNLISDDGENASIIKELTKMDSPKIINFRLIVRSPGQVVIRAKVDNQKWATGAEAYLPLEISPRPVGNCKWDRFEGKRDFTGRWLFDIQTIGPIELTLIEQKTFQISGEFGKSGSGSGKFVGKRDGNWFHGYVTFDAEPLRRFELNANYIRSTDNGLIVSQEGTALEQTVPDPKRKDWKNINKFDFRAFCSL